MRIPDVRAARDYNRSLAAPIRWVHIAAAGALRPVRPIIQWGTIPGRATWFPYIAIGFLLIIVFLPWDETIHRTFRSVRFGGDIRRELEAAQQYGQTLSSILVALVIWLQDPARRRRLADWAAAFLVTGVLATALKIFLGRPRPLLDEPTLFLGPLGAYPLGPEIGIRHAWEIWGGISSKLWSMPSSHTAYIAVMAIFISFTYPRLRYVAFALVVIVGLARVQTGAHYFTDVIAGAALGLAVAHTAMTFRWGQLALDALAIHFAGRRQPTTGRRSAPPRQDAEPVLTQGSEEGARISRTHHATPRSPAANPFPSAVPSDRG